MSRMIWPKLRVEWGDLRAEGGPVLAGNRMLPAKVIADFPGVNGQPSLYMTVEVIDGVPRCTEISIRRVSDGREVRRRDLDAVDVDEFVEVFMAAFAGDIIERTKDHAAASFNLGADDAKLRAAMKQMRDLRKGSRRSPTDVELRRVADIYNSRPSGDRYQAIEAAFGYSRATTKRRVDAARSKGFIPKKES